MKQVGNHIYAFVYMACLPFRALGISTLTTLIEFNSFIYILLYQEVLISPARYRSRSDIAEDTLGLGWIGKI
jgi:hypothetical protein